MVEVDHIIYHVHWHLLMAPATKETMAKRTQNLVWLERSLLHITAWLQIHNSGRWGKTVYKLKSSRQQQNNQHWPHKTWQDLGEELVLKHVTEGAMSYIVKKACNSSKFWQLRVNASRGSWEVRLSAELSITEVTSIPRPNLEKLWKQRLPNAFWAIPVPWIQLSPFLERRILVSKICVTGNLASS